MKEFFDVTLLGLLQGVAEFLPISSSGHLVVGQHLLNLEIPGMRLDIFLHVGTLLAIFAYYRKRIASLLTGLVRREKSAWLFAYRIVLSAIPAIIVWLAFKHPLAHAFENARLVGGLLIVTGLVLTGTRFLPLGKFPVNTLRAVLMGVGQAIALLPGISRSGMTLVAGRLAGVSGEAAAEFSFLMSAPLILGAAILEVIKAPASEVSQISWPLTLWGAALAAIVGYFSLALLVRTLKGRHFWLFGLYCLAIGTLTLFIV